MALRVAVVYGGRSGEHEVSLRSAEAIIAALDPSVYEVQRFLIGKDGRWDPRIISPEPGGNPGIDVVFPVLHGTFGEDGTIQGLLELAALPYVGAGVLASALSMDKDFTKRLLSERHIAVVESEVFLRGRHNLESIRDCFGFPAWGLALFVKPANLGSSVGISKVRSVEELAAAIDLAWQFDRKIIVERAILGREFECAVIGNDQPIAAGPCEIIPSREFYDYEDKYVLDAAVTVPAAEIGEDVAAEIRCMAIEAYRVTGCEGMARVDFLMEEATGRLYVNEINTIPGFTSISMFPKMWEAAGVSFQALVHRLIELALERHRERQSTRFAL